MTIIAPGRHAAVCRSIQWAWTSTNKEQAAVELEIEGPDDPDHGRSITWFAFFTDKAFDRSIESMRYLGWTGDDLAELPALAEAGDLAQVVEIVVVHEEYQGTVTAKIQWVNKPGGGRIKLEKPMSTDEARMFGARMRARLVGGRPSSSATAQRSAPQRASGAGSHAFDPSIPPPGQGDIPF